MLGGGRDLGLRPSAARPMRPGPRSAGRRRKCSAWARLLGMTQVPSPAKQLLGPRCRAWSGWPSTNSATHKWASAPVRWSSGYCQASERCRPVRRGRGHAPRDRASRRSARGARMPSPSPGAPGSAARRRFRVAPAPASPPRSRAPRAARPAGYETRSARSARGRADAGRPPPGTARALGTGPGQSPAPRSPLRRPARWRAPTAGRAPAAGARARPAGQPRRPARPELRDRLRHRRAVDRPSAGQVVVRRRLLGEPGPRAVEGEQFGLPLRRVRETLLQRLHDAGVQLPALAPEQALVGGVPDQRVLEGVGGLGSAPRGGRRARRRSAEPAPLAACPRRRGATAASRSKPNSRPIAAATCASSRAAGKRSSLAVRESCRVAGTTEAALQGRRGRRRPLPSRQGAGLEHRPGQLLHEQRHPVRLGRDLRRNLGRQRPTRDALDHGRRLAAAQLAEREQGGVGMVRPGRRELRTEGDDEQHRQTAHALDGEPHQLRRRRIHPVRVLEHHQDRLPGSEPHELVEERREDPLPPPRAVRGRAADIARRSGSRVAPRTAARPQPRPPHRGQAGPPACPASPRRPRPARSRRRAQAGRRPDAARCQCGAASTGGTATCTAPRPAARAWRGLGATCRDRARRRAALLGPRHP